MPRILLKLYYAPRLAWLLTLHWQGRWFVFRDQSEGLVKYIAESATPITDKHIGTFIEEARIELDRRTAQAASQGVATNDSSAKEVELLDTQCSGSKK